MTLPYREGPTRGKIVESGIVAPKLDSKTVSFYLKIECTEWYGLPEGRTEPDWCPIDTENTEITLYVYLTKKEDGAINTRSVEDIMKSLPWDGKSFAALGKADFYGQMVQFSCKQDEYQGKKTMKASFLCPFDATPHAGGPTKADDAALKNLDAQYAPKLRAIAPPSKPGAAPARPASQPTIPPPPAASRAVAPQSAPAAPGGATATAEPPADNIPF